MAGLLLSARDDTDATREKGKKALSIKERRRIAKAYDEIVTTAIRANPDPLLLGREHRTKAEKDSNNLAIAFRERKGEILRFTEDLAVWFTNNISERGFRMVNPPEDLGLPPHLRRGRGLLRHLELRLNSPQARRQPAHRPRQPVPGEHLSHPRPGPGVGRGSRTSGGGIGILREP
jgi:Transposase IS66 family